MAKQPEVWVSMLESHTRNLKQLSYIHERNDNKSRIAFIDKLRDRIPATKEEAPLYLFFKLRNIAEKKKANLPDIFLITNGLICISQRFATLLKDFNLGQTTIFDVPLYEYDQTTLRPERYSLLHIAEKKDALVPERCEGLRDLGKRWAVHYLDPLSIAVTRDALKGVDLWSDKRLRGHFFLSRRLRDAIRSEKIRASQWGLRRCEIVD